MDEKEIEELSERDLRIKKFYDDEDELYSLFNIGTITNEQLVEMTRELQNNYSFDLQMIDRKSKKT